MMFDIYQEIRESQQKLLKLIKWKGSKLLFKLKFIKLHFLIQ